MVSKPTMFQCWHVNGDVAFSKTKFRLWQQWSFGCNAVVATTSASSHMSFLKKMYMFSIVWSCLVYGELRYYDFLPEI